jgi:hypothetical protein
MSPTDRSKPPNMGPSPDGPHPDDPPSEEEIRAAAALRRVLEGQSGAGDNIELRAFGELAQSLRAAASPKALARERHHQILERVLRPLKNKNKIAYLIVGSAAGVLAMAAAVLLVIRGAAPDRSMSAKASAERAGIALALSRSTAELFPEGIPRSGGTSDRVDRIAYARAQDFRQNQFARWGAP